MLNVHVRTYDLYYVYVRAYLSTGFKNQRSPATHWIAVIGDQGSNLDDIVVDPSQWSRRHKFKHFQLSYLSGISYMYARS